MEFNSLIPELIVSDLQRSINFYVKILGFKIEYKRNNFVFISLEKNQIMLSKSDNWNTGKLERPFGRGINLQMRIMDVNGLMNKLKKGKIKLFRELIDNWYRKDKILLGNREFLVL